MANNAASAPVLLLAILVGSLAVCWRTEALDCRRYVFAPVCRGISAKRAQTAPLQFRNFQLASRLGSSHPTRFDDSEEGQTNSDYDIPQLLQDEYFRTLLRKYLSRQSQAFEEAED